MAEAGIQAPQPTPTWQEIYDADPSPLIVVNPATGALVIRDDSPGIGDVFRIESAAGDAALSVDPEDGVRIGLAGNSLASGVEPLLLVEDTGGGDGQVKALPTSRVYDVAPGATFAHGIVGEAYEYDFASVELTAFKMQGTYVHRQAGNAFGHVQLFFANATLRNENGSAVNFGLGNMFFDRTTYEADGAAVSVAVGTRSFAAQPIFGTLNAGTLAVPNIVGFLTNATVGAGVTATNRYGVHVQAVAGAGALVNNVGIRIDPLTKGSGANVGIDFPGWIGGDGIRSDMAGFSTFINHTGSAPALFGGRVRVGGDLDHDGAGVGFYGAAPVAKPNVTGSRGGNAALASLLTALASQGLVTNSTTA